MCTSYEAPGKTEFETFSLFPEPSFDYSSAGLRCSDFPPRRRSAIDRRCDFWHGSPQADSAWREGLRHDERAQRNSGSEAEL